jgi:flagellar motor protein MotB
MRETIAVIVCLLLFVVALQTGIVRTGLDYENAVRQAENLQAANDRLGEEFKRLLASGESGVTLTAEDLVLLAQRPPTDLETSKWRQKVKTEVGSVWEDYLTSREAEWVEGSDRLALRLSDKFCFAGSAPRLRREAQAPLQQLARVLQGLPDLEIQVVGHTDTPAGAPMTLAGHEARRETSLARARAVAEFLAGIGGLDPVRIIVAGRGDYQPLVSNENAALRASNRRVELEFFPADGLRLGQAHRLVRIDPGTEKPRPAEDGEETEPESGSVGAEQLSDQDTNEFGAGYDKPAEK